MSRSRVKSSATIASRFWIAPLAGFAVVILVLVALVVNATFGAEAIDPASIAIPGIIAAIVIGRVVTFFATAAQQPNKGKKEK